MTGYCQMDMNGTKTNKIFDNEQQQKQKNKQKNFSGIAGSTLVSGFKLQLE